MAFDPRKAGLKPFEIKVELVEVVWAKDQEQAEDAAEILTRQRNGEVSLDMDDKMNAIEGCHFVVDPAVLSDIDGSGETDIDPEEYHLVVVPPDSGSQHDEGALVPLHDVINYDDEYDDSEDDDA